MITDKYPLNGTHYTIEDDRQMMTDIAHWPMGDRLPLKRSTKYVDKSDGPKVPFSVRAGSLFADDVRAGIFAVWYHDDEGPTVIQYESVNEILADGWVVD